MVLGVLIIRIRILGFILGSPCLWKYLYGGFRVWAAWRFFVGYRWVNPKPLSSKSLTVSPKPKKVGFSTAVLDSGSCGILAGA